MDIKEMHILFDNLYQEINSNRKGTIKAEEKDLRINMAQHTLIKSEVDKLLKSKNSVNIGYDIRIKLAEKFKSLKREVSIVPNVESKSYGSIKTMRLTLQPDHALFVRASGINKYNCNGQTYTAIADTVKEAVVEFKEDTTHAVSYYSGFKIDITEGAVVDTVFNIASLPSEYYGTVQTMNSEQARFYIRNLVMTYFNSTDVTITLTSTETLVLKVYWERYENRYYKNHFIFVVKSYSGAAALKVKVHSVVTTITDEATFAVNANKTIYNTSAFTGNNKMFTVDLMDSEYIDKRIEDPFSKPRPYKLLGELDQRSLLVYHDNNSGINNFYLTYLKQPQQVSVRHNINCELDEIYHQDIVLLAVRSTKGDVNDQSITATQFEYVDIE